jgi:NAD(P)-dependent dehydrogenase (short-subunit alcohol dehydrogenase family)
MSKTILITGSTDGIGLATAKRLIQDGHRLLIHGRTAEKVDSTIAELNKTVDHALLEGVVADLSDFNAVKNMAHDICQRYPQLDVLINNAGVFKTPDPITADGYDLRFIVNTIAPYLLTQELASILKPDSRVINLSSAAQSPIELDALKGELHLDEDFTAYAQSKLALTAWTKQLSDEFSVRGILLVSVNPGSLLATKMVKDGFGVAGNDVEQGSDILIRASLSEEFSGKHGQYFDNDAGEFALPHPDALDEVKNQQTIAAMEQIIQERSQ